jgi:arylsulfatase A-like enzyme
VAGIYDQTIFVVTADHGMIPNDRNIDPAQFRSLRRFGQVGKPYTWLSNPSQAAIVAEAIAKLNVPDVIGIYAKIKDASGAYHFESAPTTQAKLDPTLNAAYLYLTSTFASSHGPDIVLTSSENTQFGKASTGKRGGHSEVTWGDQHIPLLIVGPGVKQGVVSHAPARLVDIAPTVLALLGIVHGPMDGVVLADALVSPSTDQLAAQTKVTNELTPLRDALRARSQADLAGQR